MNKTAKEILKENRLLSSYWGRRIVKAEARGVFSKRDVRKAACWTTCACGEQDARIPRDGDGEPLDEKLTDLGCRFYRNTLNCNAAEAAETLVKIERRAAEVLQELA